MALMDRKFNAHCPSCALSIGSDIPGEAPRLLAHHIGEKHMKRQNLFRKMRGIPDRVLGQALGNHQQNLQMLVASHGQLRHGVVLVGRIAIAALVVAVIALIVAVVR